MASARRDRSGTVRVCCLLLTGAVCIASTGCGESPTGPPVHPVSGKVTFEGNAVKAGVIAFADNEKGAIYEATLEGGSYEMESQHGNGIPAGSYKVSVYPPSPPPSNDPNVVTPPPTADDIPEKYRAYDSSGFTAEVKEGGGTFDFEMKK